MQVTKVLVVNMRQPQRMITDLQYMFTVVSSVTTTTFGGTGTVENDYGNDDKDLK